MPCRVRPALLLALALALQLPTVVLRIDDIICWPRSCRCFALTNFAVARSDANTSARKAALKAAGAAWLGSAAHMAYRAQVLLRPRLALAMPSGCMLCLLRLCSTPRAAAGTPAGWQHPPRDGARYRGQPDRHRRAVPAPRPAKRVIGSSSSRGRRGWRQRCRLSCASGSRSPSRARTAAAQRRQTEIDFTHTAFTRVSWL